MQTGIGEEPRMTTRDFQTGAGTSRRAVIAGAGALAAAGLSEAQAQGRPEEIIDIHAHIISRDLAKYPPQIIPGRESDWAKERRNPVEELLTEMDAAGVAKAAMVQVSTFYGINNTYLADSIAKAPKRLTGVCSLDVLVPETVKILDVLIGRGITGLRIFTGAADRATLTDPRSFPVWEHMLAKRLPINLQTDAKGLPYVVQLLKRFPRNTVILDHIAHPDLSDGAPYAAAASLWDLAQYPNLHLKITPRTFELANTGKATPETFFPALVKAFGAARIAWGSNMPSDLPPMTRIVAETRKNLASLSPADRAMVLSGTAKKLYPSLA